MNGGNKMYFDKYEEEQGRKILEAYMSGENEMELCNEYGLDVDGLEEIIRIELRKRDR
jgi:uncharacterized protein (DUF433 family)